MWICKSDGHRWCRLRKGLSLNQEKSQRHQKSKYKPDTLDPLDGYHFLKVVVEKNAES
jgi:hypothetical protein